MVRAGRSKALAKAPGSMALIESSEAIPVITRSTSPIFSIAAANTRAVATTSEPANASSLTKTALSAPICRARRKPSSASCGPIESATTSPSCSSTKDTAASTAFSSSSFRTSSSPRTRRSSSRRRSDCTSGTCFTQTTIFIANRLPQARQQHHVRPASRLAFHNWLD